MTRNVFIKKCKEREGAPYAAALEYAENKLLDIGKVKAKCYGMTRKFKYYDRTREGWIEDIEKCREVENWLDVLTESKKSYWKVVYSMAGGPCGARQYFRTYGEAYAFASKCDAADNPEKITTRSWNRQYLLEHDIYD